MATSRGIIDEQYVALIAAVDAGQLDQVEKLIRAGSYINGNPNNRYCSIPLHRAIWKGNIEMVQLLLSLGANVDLLDASGTSPLYDAVAATHLEIAKLLLENGAAIYNGSDRWTPLHVACSLPLIDLLLSHGSDIEAKNKYGCTPLQLSFDTDNIEKARLLLLRGANINSQNNQGDTALHEAACKSDPAKTTVLLSLGAKVNIRCYQGESPLEIAVSCQREQQIKVLLEAGADVPDNLKENPLILHIQSTSNVVETIKLCSNRSSFFSTIPRDIVDYGILPYVRFASLA